MKSTSTRIAVVGGAAALFSVGAIGGLTLFGGGASADRPPAPPVSISELHFDEIVGNLPEPVAGEHHEAADLAGYQRAVEAQQQCLERGIDELARANGVEGLNIEFGAVETSSDLFQASFSYSVHVDDITKLPPGAENLRADLEHQCFYDEVSTIERRYQAEVLSDPSFVAAAEASFRTCARASGQRVHGHQPAREVLLDSYEGGLPNVMMLRCMSSHPVINGIPFAATVASD